MGNGQRGETGLAVSGQVDGVLDYTIELRPTRDHGAEVVVFLINEAEGDMVVSGVTVRYRSGLLRRTRHPVYFRDADRRGVLDLPQYVVREGHFHLGEAALRRRVLEAVFELEYRLGPSRARAKVVRRVPTEAIHRSTPGRAPRPG